MARRRRAPGPLGELLAGRGPVVVPHRGGGREGVGGQTRLVPVLTGGSGAAGRWRATAFSTCSARLRQRCHLLAAFDLVGAEPGWRHPGVSTGGTKRSGGAVASCLIAASPPRPEHLLGDQVTSPLRVSAAPWGRVSRGQTARIPGGSRPRRRATWRGRCAASPSRERWTCPAGTSQPWRGPRPPPSRHHPARSMVHLHRSLVPSGLPRHLYCPFFGGTYRYRPDLAVADRADFELVLPALGLPAAH